MILITFQNDLLASCLPPYQPLDKCICSPVAANHKIISSRGLFSVRDADLIPAATWGNATIDASRCDSRKWRSGLPGSSSSQHAPHSAEASGFPHGGQRVEGVSLKLSAQLSQQELQPASPRLVFI